VRAQRTISVDIPAGIETGLRLQMPGQGEVGPAGGPNGDLFLEMKVRHHDVFSRSDDDLLATVEVQMLDAILGTTVTLDGLDDTVEVHIKPGTQSGEVLTVKERGITSLRGGGRGDLRLGIQVVTPTKLSGAEQTLIKQLSAIRKNKAPEFAEFQQGLFAKLRDRFL